MHWLRHKQPAQDLVQFGLMTAAVAIVALAGLEFLSGTIRWYFGDVAPTIAPPAASVPGFPLHKLNMSFTCSGSQLVVGASTKCEAVLSDADTLNPVPISGTLSIASSGGQFVGCTTLSPSSPSSAQCVGTFSSNQGGQFVLTASFVPTSNHINADTLAHPVKITVFGVSKLQASCSPTSVSVDSPTVCSASLQDAAAATALAGRDLTWSITQGSGTLTCSSTEALGNCNTATPFTSATCATDSAGQCRIVLRPGPPIDQLATLRITFSDDFTSAAPYQGASTTTSVTVTAPVRHDTDADVDVCNKTANKSVLHCLVTVKDIYPAPNPPDPDNDARVPPTGSATILTRGSTLRNSTCDNLTPWAPDHSTCSFDLVRNGDDHDQVSVSYGGDALHKPDTMFTPLDVHFDGG
jgi:hypothetical protein